MDHDWGDHWDSDLDRSLGHDWDWMIYWALGLVKGWEFHLESHWEKCLELHWENGWDGHWEKCLELHWDFGWGHDLD